MDFANRFKILRKEKGYTQQQIADLCFLDKSAVCRWEKGDNYPNQQTQSKLADLLGVSIDYLMGRTDMRMISFPSEAVIDMPIIGSVRAGMNGNIVNEEEEGETRTVAAAAVHGRPQDYFVLRVRGNSMYPEVLDGDCVLVKKTDNVESGSMAVVLYDGDYATVKWVRYVEGEETRLDCQFSKVHYLQGFCGFSVQNNCANLCQFAPFCRILCHILCHKSGHKKSPLRRVSETPSGGGGARD